MQRDAKTLLYELREFSKGKKWGSGQAEYLALSLISVCLQIYYRREDEDFLSQAKEGIRGLYNLLSAKQDLWMHVIHDDVSYYFWAFAYSAFLTVFPNAKGKMVLYMSQKMNDCKRLFPQTGSNEPFVAVKDDVDIPIPTLLRSLGRIMLVARPGQAIFVKFLIPERLMMHASACIIVNGNVIACDLSDRTSITKHCNLTKDGETPLFNEICVCYNQEYAFGWSKHPIEKHVISFKFITDLIFSRPIETLDAFYDNSIPCDTIPWTVRTREYFQNDAEVTLVECTDEEQETKKRQEEGWFCPILQDRADMPIFSLKCKFPHVFDMKALYMLARISKKDKPTCPTCGCVLDESDLVKPRLHTHDHERSACSMMTLKESWESEEEEDSFSWHPAPSCDEVEMIVIE